VTATARVREPLGNDHLRELRATPASTAGALGLRWKSSGDSYLTWDVVLDLAVTSYWQRRYDDGKRAA
jgi:hypothetical protein